LAWASPAFAAAAANARDPGPDGIVSFEHRATLLPHGDPYGLVLESFGIDGAISGDRAVVGAPGSVSARVFVRSGGAWSEQQRLTAADPVVFGVSVAMSGDTIAVGGVGAGDPVPGPGAVFVFVRSGSTWILQQKLQPPGITDRFGASIALAGDTLVVGDPSDGPFAGAMYVFERSGSVWSPPQKLTASNTAANDRFGTAVTLSGDAARLVVTAPNHGSLIGSAYVFDRSGATWTEQPMLTPAGATGQYLFGNAVSISGDTIAVGASGADTAAGTNAGAVHVFVRDAGAWSEQQPRLLADDAVAETNLGRSVTIEGDTLVAGAYYGFTGPQEGAYVFTRTGTSWTQQQKLLADQPGIGRFGSAVEVAGDTLLVGASQEDVRGAVYAFARTGNTWTADEKLLSMDFPNWDELGSAAAVSGDTLAVGAPNDSGPAAEEAGSVTLYVRSGSSVAEQEKIFAQVPDDAEFGAAVALSGDTLLVGAWFSFSPFPTRSGTAYVFVRAGGTWTLQQKLDAPDATDDLHFGRAVALDGDTAVVGTEVSSGGAYVFVRKGTTWTFQQKITVSDQSGFGGALALQGDTLVVGDKYYSAGANQTGAAFVFVRSGNTWTQQGPMLTASDASVLARFGHSVALSGDTAVVGNQRVDTLPGSAYVFVRSGGTWAEQQKLTASDGTTDDFFGDSVTVQGDVAVVGAPTADPPGAYVFTRSGGAWTEQQKLLDPAGTAAMGSAVALADGTLLVGARFELGGFTGSAHVFDLPADLSISKNDGAATAVPGEPITYTIRVDNAGPNPAAATVDDVVPAAVTGATWTCSASVGSSCTPVGSGDIHDTVSLLAGGSATYELVGTIAPSATGTLANTATVAATSGTYEPNLANNTSVDTDTLTPLADLGVTNADSTDPVSQGSPLTYTLMVTNAGPSDGRSVQLIDTLPAGVTFVSSTPGPPTCTHVAGTVTCDLSVLLAAGSASVTIDVSVTAASGVLVNAASVSGKDDDPALGNNQATAATAVGRRDAELAHATSAVHDLGGDAEDLFRMVQSPLASYEVVVDGASGDIGTGEGPLVQRVGADGTTVLQDSAPAGAGPSRSLRWMNETSSTVESETVRVRSAACTTDCGADDVYRIRAYETTLRVPRFNNAGTQVTVLALQNPTDATISGKAYFHLASGAAAAMHPFSLGPRQTLVLNTAGLSGVAGVAGTITIVHDGRYGELAGKSVALEPATGFSFDSPAEVRPR
jgi:uncharacterized repeat protein (TIGR01451 family)